MRFIFLTLFLTLSTVASAAPAKLCTIALLESTSPPALVSADTGSGTIRSSGAIRDLSPAPYQLVIDDRDKANFAARESIFEKVAQSLISQVGNVESDASARLTLLNKNQSFRFWFKTMTSISHGLDEKNLPFDAQVKLVEKQEDGLRAKIEMIRQASHTVDLTYFIFTPDDAGLAILHELKLAVRRGVRVRVMIDGLGSVHGSMDGNPHFKAFLQDAAINAGFMKDERGNLTTVKATAEVVIFNPISGWRTWWRNWSANRRSHDKILITDAMYPARATAMIGGRNIETDYFTPVNGEGHPMIDYEIIVKNAAGVKTPAHEADVGKVLNDYFERLYFHAANHLVIRDLLSPLYAPPQLDKMKASAESVEAATDDAARSGQVFSLTEGFHSEQVELINTIENILRKRVLRNLKRPDRMPAPTNGNGLNRRMRELFMHTSEVEARTGQAESAYAVSPYLTFTPQELKLIIKWMAANPERTFTVITSSIQSNNHVLAQVLVDDSLAKLFEMAKERGLASRLKLYCYGRADDKELGGSVNYGTLHEKSFLLKQAQASAVITYNGDPRGHLLNSESGMVLYGLHSSTERERHFQDLIAISHEFRSEEWGDIRNRVTGLRADVVKFQSRAYKMLYQLKIWWLL